MLKKYLHTFFCYHFILYKKKLLAFKSCNRIWACSALKGYLKKIRRVMCQIWTLYLIKHFVTFLFINFGIIFLVTDIKLLYLYLNPIPAGVLENQDTRGEGVNPPPPLNPMFDVQIWQMIHHYKALGLWGLRQLV